MQSRQAAVETQYTNVIGTLNLLFSLRDRVPDCHLIKLGTMGEYGTPDIDIEEGFIEIEHKGRSDTLPVPEAAGLPLPLLQGPRLDQHPLRLPDLGAAGDRPEPGRRLRHRDRRDGRPGAADHPLRLRRDLRHGAEPLLRSGRDRPPAHRLRRGRADARLPQHPGHPAMRRAGRRRIPPPAASSASSTSSPSSSPSPSWPTWCARPATTSATRSRCRTSRTRRVELESHYYNATHTKLLDLGLEPTHLGEELVESIIHGIERYKDRVIRDAIDPRIRWKPGQPAASVQP